MAGIFDHMRDGEQRIAVQQPVPSPAATDIARKVLLDGFEDRVPLARKPSLGIVLGTGMGSLVDQLEEKMAVDFLEMGWLPSVTAVGHAGRLVWGNVGNHSVVMLQGRVHAYEGQPVEMLYRGIELFAALGIERVLLTNASGGLTTDLVVGEIVVLNDHIDLVRNALAKEYLQTNVGYVYDELLASEAVHAAQVAGHRCRRGVYAYCLGPNYETRAEYRMLKMLGADVVGMSTVPEVIVARSFGMRVVAASVVTNLADSIDREDRQPLDGEDVCQTAASARNGMWAIAQHLLRKI
jgi:purine-nucleoside phosphorylase